MKINRKSVYCNMDNLHAFTTLLSGFQSTQVEGLINVNRFIANNRTHNLFLSNFDHHLSCNASVVLWLSTRPELENDGLISAVVKFKLPRWGLEFKPRYSRRILLGFFFPQLWFF